MTRVVFCSCDGYVPVLEEANKGGYASSDGSSGKWKAFVARGEIRIWNIEAASVSLKEGKHVRVHNQDDLVKMQACYPTLREAP